MAVRRAAKVPRDAFEAREVEALERKVREAGALPLAKVDKLCPTDLTAGARARLVAELGARGLERTAKVVRVPVADQLRALVGTGERVLVKNLPKRVKGATGPEVKAALTALVLAGVAHVVVRGHAEALVGGSDKVLDRDGLARLFALGKALTALGKKVSAKGGPRTVLAEDLELLLAPLEGLVAPKQPAAAERAAVWDALARLGRDQHGLVSIPMLVRALPAIRFETTHALLLDEERAGRVELRTETSVGSLLPPSDRALCIEGPSGDLLSYALLLAGGRS